MNRKAVLVLGASGNLGPSIINGLLRDYLVIGISRKASKANLLDNYKGIDFDIENGTLDEVRGLINSLFIEYEITGAIINFYYGYPSSPESLADESIVKACMGIYGKQMQFLQALFTSAKKELSIVVISSMYASTPPVWDTYCAPTQFNALVYGSMKSALEQGCKWLLSYYSQYRIRLNILRLGPFPGQMVKLENPEFIQRLSSQTLVDRVGLGDDIVGLVRLLLSGEGSFINGSTITVDGGWRIAK